MPLLTSRAPHPALAEHPEFAMMLAMTLERYRCTAGEVREDYWLGRVWRALAGDPALNGRVAREGVGRIIVTGTGYSAAPPGGRERDQWHRRVERRVEVDTGRPPADWGVSILWAERRVEVKPAALVSLLAQTVACDPRWGDLAAYAGDLAPIVVPVAYTAEAFVAA